MALKAKRSAALLWHVTALASSAYGFSSLHVLPVLLGVNMENEYGGFFQFLTMCGLAGTTATMALALILDVFEAPEALRWLKDLVMAASLPTETIITGLYWTIMAINKDLMMLPRKIMDPANPGQVLGEESVAVPFHIDASLHAFPGVFLLVDFIVFSRRLPRSIPMAAVAATVAASYSLWAEKCARMNGHYPYPLLEIMNTPQRTAFYCAAGIVAMGVGLAVTRLQAKLRDNPRGHKSARAGNARTN